jgi:hypothetical protein
LGSISPGGKVLTLQALFIVPDAGDIEPRTPGPYAIVLRNARGEELARYPFTPDQSHSGPVQPSSAAQGESDSLSISELVPFVAGATRVDIEGPGGGLLHTVTAGPNTPTVAVVSPNGGETLTGPTVTVSWSANDLDGDPLTFNVQYSNDNGASWKMVAQNVTGNSVVLDSTNLPAGDKALFRVWVSDGIHTASDTSDGVFVIPNHPPTVEIVQPAADVTIVVSQTLNLQANAYDADLGTLDGNQVEWRSDLDGFLGFGSQTSVVGLSVGTHTITARVNDGQGGTASDSVRVKVVQDASELSTPDGLLVGPTTLLFNTATGETSALVSLDNQNNGAPIAWNAQADVPWLKLSAPAGVTPDDVTLSAITSGLAEGDHAATVTFTSPAAPNQQATIQVQLHVAQRRPYLPLILR